MRWDTIRSTRRGIAYDDRNNSTEQVYDLLRNKPNNPDDPDGGDDSDDGDDGDQPDNGDDQGNSGGSQAPDDSNGKSGPIRRRRRHGYRHRRN